LNNNKDNINISGNNHLLDEIAVGTGFETSMTDKEGFKTSTTEINELKQLSKSEINRENNDVEMGKKKKCSKGIQCLDRG